MKTYFETNYVLTDDQKELVAHLNKFLYDNQHVFLLKGYAGTGKTFIMKGLTEYLKSIKRLFRIAAPTGRAAKVISEKTGERAYTIHKTIYSFINLKEYKDSIEDETESYKFYYDLKLNDDSTDCIYIVDEASMISDIYSEGEFFRFGSGHLLADLIRYINFSHNHTRKVIFIGDDAQLPPIGMNHSPALDQEYICKNYNLKTTQFQLTEVVRQKSCSGILHNATTLRNAIKHNKFNKLEISNGYTDIREIAHHAFMDEYMQACNHSIDEDTIVIAWSNSSVKEYNDAIRSQFFPGKESITSGDKIILVSNNYNYPPRELLNGDFGIIKEVAPFSESRYIPLRKKKSDNNKNIVQVKLIFREVFIEFADSDNTKYNIRCKIIENLLHSVKRDLSSEELKAMYVDFKLRNPQLKPGSKEFKDTLKTDNYFNALRIKFGYAITCHKAQGGEWMNTFLNCNAGMGYNNTTYFRWLYTGITRSGRNLYVLDFPRSNIEQVITQLPEIINIGEIAVNIESQFDFTDVPPVTKYIHHSVKEVLNDINVTITDINHFNFLEQYRLKSGDIDLQCKIYYNVQNKISIIEMSGNKGPEAEKIYAKLSELKDKIIIVEEAGNLKLEHEFKFEHGFLKDFYLEIKEKLLPEAIIISKIEHKTYHEIYEFNKNGLTAAYKFWYNGKNVFTRTEIITSRTTGLTETINKII